MDIFFLKKKRDFTAYIFDLLLQMCGRYGYITLLLPCSMLGVIVVEQNYFNLSQLGIEPRLLDLHANTLQQASIARQYRCIIHLHHATRAYVLK